MGMPEHEQQGYTEHAESDPAHGIFHMIGDSVGYGPLLILVIVGAIVVFKKKIKSWLS